MANLYTRTGDMGQTGLVGGSRVSKTDSRVECYGTIDEMGSAMGLARSLSNRDYVKSSLVAIQGRLFSLAAEIASDDRGIKKLDHLISEDDISFLEGIVDKCTETNGIQTAFVVPGMNPVSGALHLARTIVRRCERRMLHLSRETEIRPVLIKYVNRLSDAVYALARLEETLGEREELKEKVRQIISCILKENADAHKNYKEDCNMLPFSLENLLTIAARAREKAAEINVPIVFAAVDEGGNLVLLQRMEGSFLGSIDIAIGKAYTATAFKSPTHEFGKSCQPGGSLYGIHAGNNGKIVIFGGGFPYEQEGRIVGGIGVSGGTVEEDMEIARYALGE